MRIDSDSWNIGLGHERTSWQQWLSPASPFPVERDDRLQTERQIPNWLAARLDPAVVQPRVLDVGSGPLSALGTQWGDRDVELVPVDILAREYADDLEAAGLTAPVPPRCRPSMPMRRSWR